MVQKYQNVVQHAIQTKGYVVNEFGRRYYIKNSRFAYKCGNYLIQGTCADAVKEIQIKVYRLLKDKHLRTRVIISVHDEIIIEVADGEDFIIKDIINIMQDQKWALCPFKVEPEMFTDNWANKSEVSL